MSRSGSRDEREQANEAPQPGRMVLSRGRSGGAISASDEAKEEQSSPRSDRRPTAEPRSLSVVVPEREQPTALIRSRDLVFVRNRSYRISSAEREMMTEIGKFRTIAVADLARHRYPKEPGTLRHDLLNLKAQKLVRQRRVMAGKGQEKLSVLVLTREGKHLVQQEYRAARGQSFYAGLVKPREVAHDAAIYRMYQVEAAEIEKRGGSVKRIVLDYELKKNLYKPLAKARNLPPLEYAKRQAEVAADNGLKDPKERVVLIEDTSEIQVSLENLVEFEARREGPDQRAVTIRELLRATLRHRPDRIILGEVRGGEAFDLLQALNTGHSGTLSTIHANSAEQAVTRFISCVLQSGIELPYRAIRSNIGDVVQLLLHIERRSGRRYVAQLLRVIRYDSGQDRYEFEPVYQSESR